MAFCCPGSSDRRGSFSRVALAARVRGRHRVDARPGDSARVAPGATKPPWQGPAGRARGVAAGAAADRARLLPPRPHRKPRPGRTRARGTRDRARLHLASDRACARAPDRRRGDRAPVWAEPARAAPVLATVLSGVVAKQYGDFALDVAWDATESVVALVGPSGSGKTLTLQCLAGLVRPDRGRIVL